MPTKSTKPVEKKKAEKTVKAPKKVAEVKVAPVKAEKTVKPVVAKAVIEPKSAKKTAKPAKAGSNDTGSIDFQVTNFTKKIKVLTDHLKEHKHDFDSRRGLLIMVGKRRRLLNYLRKTEPEKYLALIKTLKLKR